MTSGINGKINGMFPLCSHTGPIEANKCCWDQCTIPLKKCSDFCDKSHEANCHISCKDLANACETTCSLQDLSLWGYDSPFHKCLKSNGCQSFSAMTNVPISDVQKSISCIEAEKENIFNCCVSGCNAGPMSNKVDCKHYCEFSNSKLSKLNYMQIPEELTSTQVIQCNSNMYKSIIITISIVYLLIFGLFILQLYIRIEI